MFNFTKVLRSFKFAGAGVRDLFRYENNARVHLMAAIAVTVAGIYFGLSRIEWALIGLAIGGVCAAEAFNTALEKLCDLVSPGYHPQVKSIKDLAAGGVLLATLAAIVVGVCIFGSRIF
jgi:diacylglycerol kinase